MVEQGQFRSVFLNRRPNFLGRAAADEQARIRGVPAAGDQSHALGARRCGQIPKFGGIPRLFAPIQ
jgi:hypothetical protein